jgi:hypothetical protein
MSLQSLGLLPRSFGAACLALVAFACFSIAKAADVTVTVAKIEAGRLIISGTTLTANMPVRLEGSAAASFNVISGPNPARAFSFNIVYHPGDCIVAVLGSKHT